jgi:formylglycine-generating enzyme required for sulfatase activity/dienelactone hydrolase
VKRVERRPAGPPPEKVPRGEISELLQELARTPDGLGASWEHWLRPGAVIGRYELVREIGRGGFGVVWEARDRELGRAVAFKAVRAGERLAAREERLLQEAEAAARLAHPNIVTLFDVGRCEHGPFLIEELLRGQTLAARLEQGPLPAREALRIAVEIAKGLAHAHDHGVVHRDLKPENVFLCDDGQVKVLDLGMAHAFGHRVLPGGTRSFMAPEQWRGAPEDERTDVFALGVILFRMLAGELPFHGDGSESARGARHAPTLKVPDPPGLAPLVRRMLDGDPVARPRDASEVLAALTSFQRESERGAAAAPVPSAWPRARSRWVIAFALATVLAAVAMVTWFVRREARIRWALQDALPRVTDLAELSRYAEALLLAEEVERVVPRDPRLLKLWPEMARSYSVETVPGDADVSVKEYSAPDSDWKPIGRSPIAAVRLPLGFYRWRVEKAGYATVEAAAGRMRPFGEQKVVLQFALDPVGSIPPEMVRVPGAPVTLQLPGLEHLPPVQLGDYLIDRTEVTNRQFKRFVDAGGYRNRDFWQHAFVKDGRVVPWAEAVALFRDRTGRPGPATWASSDYPEGQGDLPVTGVSWYEAAAFAAFEGKALPNVYQWSRAAGAWASLMLVPLSNFGGKGLAPVASHRGMGPFGTYDMAGNAKEWCWNAAGTKRYILGGAWDEPSYMFNDPDAQSPFARAPNFGFRLVKTLDDRTAPAAAESILPSLRDYNKEKPVGTEIARAFLRAYAYDRTPLEVRTEGTDEASERWRKEKVSFTAAYGGERIVAYLFTPRHVAPPFQTVVFFPGSNAIYQRSSESLDYIWIVAPIIRSGRALLFPVYKSTYERGDGMENDLPAPTAAYRDHVVMWAKDLRRSIDYVETRSDLDAGRVALYGFSWGAMLGPLLVAVEDRVRTGILVGGGLAFQKCLPEADPFNFAPLVIRPMLMVNGRYDFYFSVDTSQAPLFQLLGSPTKDKRHVVFESGHLPPNDLLTQEVLDWLDRHLGAVR